MGSSFQFVFSYCVLFLLELFYIIYSLLYRFALFWNYLLGGGGLVGEGGFSSDNVHCCRLNYSRMCPGLEVDR